MGKTDSASYYFMLPNTKVGGSFQAMLMTNFLPNNGNWQNWMDCTAA